MTKLFSVCAIGVGKQDNVINIWKIAKYAKQNYDNLKNDKRYRGVYLAVVIEASD